MRDRYANQLRCGVFVFLAGLLCASAVSAAEFLTAREIVARAIQAAGGDGWQYAKTIRLTGQAHLHRGGNVAGVLADDYEMLRVYPTRLDDADTATGKFRLDARMQGRVLFQSSFDGRHMYDQRGRLPDEEGALRAAAAFGFSAIRFALTEGFELQRLADDQVEGHAVYFIRVIDPSGGKTLFAIDQQDYSIRLVGWDTPQGWHHRIYSDFYWVEDPGFRQPGRVRLFYDGIKSVDIRWTSAEVNLPIADSDFVLAGEGPDAARR